MASYLITLFSIASFLISAHRGGGPCCPSTSVYALPVRTRTRLECVVTMMGIMIIISMVGMSSTVIIVPRVGMKDMAITLNVVCNEHGDHDEHHTEHKHES